MKSFRSLGRGVPRLTIVVTLASASLVLAGCTNASHPSTGLTTTTSSKHASYVAKHLPQSRDNDAGKARMLDVTPDNDTDAWQRG
jgi:outer membrane PBP1 activator LpoA protein